MSEQPPTPLRLTTHPTGAGQVEVRWILGGATAPFHGAWLPSSKSDDLVSLLDRIPLEAHRNLRILREEQGWFVLLLSGQLSESPTPWPLRRAGNGPFVFHPAEVSPVPPIPQSLIVRVCADSNLVGRVEEGRIRWCGWSPVDTSSPGDLLRLPLETELFKPQAPMPAEAFPESYPIFLSEELPKSNRFESDESKRLRALQDPPPSFWSRFFKRKRPPSSIEWQQLLKSESSAIRRGIRSFWAWVDRKVAPLAPGSSPGILRRLFDPDQWSIGPGFLKNLLDRQAAMFDRLTRLFERGDLDLALKHSIPIDNDLIRALKRSGQLSLSWQLPENLVDYSFGALTPTASGPSIPTPSDRIAFMSGLYRKAAERLSGEGRHRQAAYVYAHLLKDYVRAAEELEKGGFHLEAATLLKEKLGKPILAAQVLERGGYIPEAVALYVKERAFEPAIEACERAGMKEEAERLLRLWLEELVRRGERLPAGDLLRDRLKDPGAARVMYQVELRALKGLRGEAGGRLVALEIDGGQSDLRAWEECEAVLRSELQHPDQFVSGMAGLVKFHREVRKWSKERRLADPLREGLFRRSRESLLSAVREAQRVNRGDARGQAVSALTELLADGSDPLVIKDLRRGLELGHEPAPRRSSLPRRRSAGILPLPGGGFFCCVLNSWAWMDASGTNRTPLQALGSLVVSVAINPVPDPVGDALAAMVTHDHRISIVKISKNQVTVVAGGSVSGACTIVSEPERPEFLVGTTEGTILRVWAPKPKWLDARTCFANPELGPLRWLGWWIEGATLIGVGDGPHIEDFMRNTENRFERSEPIPSSIGALNPLVLAPAAAFCMSRAREFGILRPSSGAVERLEALEVPTAGITSAAWVESDSAPASLVVLGYEDGRVAIAEISVEATPTLRLEKLFIPSLGPIVAIQGLQHGRVIAVDVEFNCAIIDTRSMTLSYQGAWNQG